MKRLPGEPKNMKLDGIVQPFDNLLVKLAKLSPSVTKLMYVAYSLVSRDHRNGHL